MTTTHGNAPKNRTRVGVLYGGRSSEHEVSLQSATNVMAYLDPTIFEVIPIGIDKTGHWFLGQEVFQKSIEYNQVTKTQPHAPTWFSPEWVMQHVTTHPNKTERAFDVIFPAVHGTFCEDGSLQGLLTLADIPYVGCGVLASALCMDKDIAKRLALSAGIQVGPYLVVKDAAWRESPESVLSTIANSLKYPLFVKPANTGSSVGISKVHNENVLPTALNDAFLYDNKILVEEALSIRELEVAVLEPMDPTAPPIVSVVGEIKPHHEFYSYEAKYIDEHGASLIAPATLPENISQKARDMAQTIFLALECEGMARVDLFYDETNNALYFNEINTIPGFTKISMYPRLMSLSNLSYPQLLTHLIQLAIERHARKTRLQRHFIETK